MVDNFFLAGTLMGVQVGLSKLSLYYSGAGGNQKATAAVDAAVCILLSWQWLL